MSRTFKCVGCGEAATRKHEIYMDVCRECKRKFDSAAYFAVAAVSGAVSAGIIKAAREFDCVDCGDSAMVYDHRDYAAPLSVDPVCKPCNWKRGSAIWRPQYMEIRRGHVAPVMRSIATLSGRTEAAQ